MRKLELQFKNEDGKIVTIVVDDPIEPVHPQRVSQAMDTIIQQNVFMTAGGELVSKHGARVVEQKVTLVELEV
mgnify:CR=1 FL=1